MSKYLIYGLKNPKTQEIRYIGRSSSGMKRPYEHLRPHQLTKKTHKSSWIKSLLSKDLTPEVVVLQSFVKHESLNKTLNEAEIYWMAYYKDNGHRLTNHTRGGKGILGYRHSEESKKKIAEANKTQDYSLHKEALSRGVSTYYKKEENRLKQAIACGAKPFFVYKNENIIGEWQSIRKCARDLNLDSGSVTRVLKGEYSHTKGFIMEYKEVC